MNQIAAPRPAPSIPSTSQSAPRLERMSPHTYRTLLLGIMALAAAMAAEGVQTFAEMRERHYAIVARQQAVSPVPYGTPLPALHALAAAGAGARVVVRSDSAAAVDPALCALAAATSRDADVRWIAFSADVDPCFTRTLGARMLRAGAPAAAEMRGARWVVMDAEGRARYSRRETPSVEQLRRTAALLAPAASAKEAR